MPPPPQPPPPPALAPPPSSAGKETKSGPSLMDALGGLGKNPMARLKPVSSSPDRRPVQKQGMSSSGPLAGLDAAIKKHRDAKGHDSDSESEEDKEDKEDNDEWSDSNDGRHDSPSVSPSNNSPKKIMATDTSQQPSPPPDVKKEKSNQPIESEDINDTYIDAATDGDVKKLTRLIRNNVNELELDTIEAALIMAQDDGNKPVIKIVQLALNRKKKSIGELRQDNAKESSANDHQPLSKSIGELRQDNAKESSANDHHPLSKGQFAESAYKIPINYGMESMIPPVYAPSNDKTKSTNAVLSDGLCEDHGKEKLFYCSSCKMFICMDCEFINHPKITHDIIGIRDHFNNRKSSKLKDIECAIKKLQDVQETFKNTLDTLETDKTKLNDNLKEFQAVMSSLQDTMSDIDTQYQVQTKQKQDVQEKLDKLSSVIEEVNNTENFEELSEAERNGSCSISETESLIKLNDDTNQNQLSMLQKRSAATIRSSLSALTTFKAAIREYEMEKHSPTNNVSTDISQQTSPPNEKNETSNLPIGQFKPELCEDHEEKRSSYCNTCKIFICLHCIMTDHKGDKHDIIKFRVALDNIKSSNGDAIECEIERLHGLQKKITDKMQILYGFKTKLNNDVQQFENVESQILMTMSDIDAQLEEQTKEKQDIQEEVEKLSVVKQQFTGINSFVEVSEAVQNCLTSIEETKNMFQESEDLKKFKEKQKRTIETIRCPVLTAFDGEGKEEDEEGVEEKETVASGKTVLTNEAANNTGDGREELLVLKMSKEEIQTAMAEGREVVAVDERGLYFHPSKPNWRLMSRLHFHEGKLHLPEQWGRDLTTDIENGKKFLPLPFSLLQTAAETSNLLVICPNSKREKRGTTGGYCGC